MNAKPVIAATCTVHAAHTPRVADIDVHHVWPMGMGGPDVPGNRVTVCPTGHRNIHELLREYLHRKGVPAWAVRRRYHPAERDLAKLGWERLQRRAM